MIAVKTIDVLPVPVSVLARNFFESDANEPEIYEVTASEYDKLASTDSVVTQLLYWRREHKFFAVLAGDAERKVASTTIIHTPFQKKCSILAFYEVDEADIRLWKRKYGTKMMDDNIVEMTEDEY